MRIIGITGGIGSGKSYISRQYALQGVPLYDCDTEAKRLEVQDPQVRQALIQTVGAEVYHPDGSLNKPFLAQYLFANEENASRISRIVHPAVRRDIQRWCQQHQDADMVIIESAIFEESGLRDLLDELWLVTAPLETRIQRVMLRDHCTRQQVLQRIAQQHQVANPDKVIENS